MGAFYLIAPLVGVGFGAVLAALVVLQRRLSPLHRVFLVFLVSMTLWALTVFGMRNSQLEQALPWEMAIFAVLPIVSVSSYHLVLLVTHANNPSTFDPDKTKKQTEDSNGNVQAAPSSKT